MSTETLDNTSTHGNGENLLAPGIHRGIPNAEYRAWPFACNSGLSKLKRSPLHYQHSQQHPTQTPAMTFGEAFHSRLLTPADFAREWAVEPDFGDCRRKENKATRDEWREAHRGAKLLDMTQAECLEAMHEAVMAHPAARRLLEPVIGTEHVEVSAIFDDPDVGERCKCRADVLHPSDNGIIIDLKTTEDASPDAFSRTIHSYGYHRQAAFYTHGLATLGVPVGHFVIVAVEKSPPHAVAVYRIDDEDTEYKTSAMTAGRREVVELLALHRECRMAGEWPGYGDKVTNIGLPAWANKRTA